MRQEALLRVMLQDTYRIPGLTCSVMLSLEKRGLVEKRHASLVFDEDVEKRHVADVELWAWYLTAEGEQVARVCRMKAQLSQKGLMDDGRPPNPDW